MMPLARTAACADFTSASAWRRAACAASSSCLLTASILTSSALRCAFRRAVVSAAAWAPQPRAAAADRQFKDAKG